MHRPNLNEMNRNERNELANLIETYATPEIIQEHWDAVLEGVHDNPESFLSFHRNYLSGLENYLSENDYQEWVPLPAWNPAEPIRRNLISLIPAQTGCAI